MNRKQTTPPGEPGLENRALQYMASITNTPNVVSCSTECSLYTGTLRASNYITAKLTERGAIPLLQLTGTNTNSG